MPLRISPNVACQIQRLRRLWCVRINGLNTYNASTNKDSRVPEPENVPLHQRGCWGYRNGYTLICLESGHMFVRKGSPNSMLRQTIAILCPHGDKLRAPYFKSESLWLNEIMARFTDPYYRFPLHQNAQRAEAITA